MKQWLNDEWYGKTEGTQKITYSSANSSTMKIKFDVMRDLSRVSALRSQ
jgi:hypothetical protein